MKELWKLIELILMITVFVISIPGLIIGFVAGLALRPIVVGWGIEEEVIDNWLYRHRDSGK